MDKLRQQSIFARIGDEIKRQEEKWGVQDHPMFDQVITNRVGRQIDRLAKEYEIPTPRRAKQLANHMVDRGELTWMHILSEEHSELLEKYWDQREVVEELIQVAAVSISAIDSILRNGLNGRKKHS